MIWGGKIMTLWRDNKKKSMVIMPVDGKNGSQRLKVNQVGDSLVFTLIEWELDRKRKISHQVPNSRFISSSQTGDQQIMARQLATLINFLQMAISKIEFDYPELYEVSEL